MVGGFASIGGFYCLRQEQGIMVDDSWEGYKVVGCVGHSILVGKGAYFVALSQGLLMFLGKCDHFDGQII